MEPVKVKDLRWTGGWKYVTLVECEPGTDHITVLLEKADSPRRRWGKPYTQIAVVVRCEFGELKINGKIYSRKALGPELHEHLVSICAEASAVITIGDTYFSDPGAEV